MRSEPSLPPQLARRRAARGPLRLRAGRRDRASGGPAPTRPRWRCGQDPSACATPASRSESSRPGARCWRAARATAARSGGCSGSSARCPGEGDELASYLQAERDRGVALDSNLVRSYIELIESGCAGEPGARDPARPADRPASRLARAEAPGRRREGGLRAAPARGREPRRATGDRRGDRLRGAGPAPVRGGDPRRLRPLRPTGADAGERSASPSASRCRSGADGAAGRARRAGRPTALTPPTTPPTGSRAGREPTSAPPSWRRF